MSLYEFTNLQSILHCRDKGEKWREVLSPAGVIAGKDSTPLWYMFVTVAVQLLMVTIKIERIVYRDI